MLLVEQELGMVRVRVRGQGLATGLEVVLLLQQGRGQQGQVPHLGLLELWESSGLLSRYSHVGRHYSASY